MKRLALVTLLLITSACTTTRSARLAVPPPDPRTIAEVEATVAQPSVTKALGWIDAHHDDILAEWRTLTEINAPSGHEAMRAAAIEQRLREIRSLEVSRDDAGNIIAVRKGIGDGPTVVIDAHLDTVFEPGLEIHTEIRDGRLYAPGVGDDTRNVEALLAIARALDAAGVETRGNIVFTFTVQEESNFGGMTHFLEQGSIRPDFLIALDGGDNSFTWAGIGSEELRIHFLGPGGHTLAHVPPLSATIPLARSIERFDRIRLPQTARLNVGMLSGSSVPNAKAADAWCSVDIRVMHDADLARIDGEIRRVVSDESRRSGLQFRIDQVSRRKVAMVPGQRFSPLVRTAEAVFEALGYHQPHMSANGSNHAGVALRHGISAISTGVGPCRGSHSLDENCAIEPLYHGIQKVLVLGVQMAGLAQ
ncbi:MAG: M20/M25/M40 family metallo-hydrolase [Thermoanaerobaculia bacterium]